MINITQKERCTGCHACSSICPQSCITMSPDNEGFIYPHVDTELCIECGLCVKACPILTPSNNLKKSLPQTYACLNKNDDIRLKSSSGGVFFLIASYILKNNGVVFGAKFNQNFKVVHGYTKTIDGLYAFMGSKYVQSNINTTYIQTKDFLDLGKNVLFSGTPCQIEGLKSYLQKPYKNLFCLDIICHGVPSPKVWDKYLSFRKNIASSQIKKASFRNKNQGWKKFSLCLAFENGTFYQQTLDKDPYLRAFLKDICLRPSCYDCQFKTLHRVSDITLADFWGIQDLIPSLDDDKGTSLIFINTSNGQFLFDEIKNSLTYNSVNLNESITYNSAAIKSVSLNPHRDKFFAQLNTCSFDKLVKKLCSEPFLLVLKRKIKAYVSIIIKCLNRAIS